MHLLSIDDLTDAQIASILDEGERWFAYNRGARRNDHRLDGQAERTHDRAARPVH